MAEKAQGRTNRGKNKITLRKGEQQRPNGTYAYRWTDEHGKRRTVYAETLEELRIAEDRIAKDRMDNIKAEARYVTINDLFELWKQLKRGLKIIRSRTISTCTACSSHRRSARSALLIS